jgi:hypothetical protein
MVKCSGEDRGFINKGSGNFVANFVDNFDADFIVFK